MFERSGQVLKIVCLGLAALMLIQFVRIVARSDPLAKLKVPAAILSLSGSNTLSTAKATNSVARPESVKKETNLPPVSKATNTAIRAMMPGPRMGPGSSGPPLPPVIQSRVDRITQSEIFAPIVRPLPMALLGIAGQDAFLRSPNGQTGMMKVGDELGGIKLLRIGTNRVLIEHEGQKKELSVFSGLGSETLMPKGKDNPQ